MSYLSAPLASISLESLITVIEWDELSEGLTDKEAQFILDSFTGNQRDFGDVDDVSKALKFTVHLHELRHFHDLLLSSYGVAQFHYRIHKYFNFAGVLIPILLRAKEITLPLTKSQLLTLGGPGQEAFVEALFEKMQSSNDQLSDLNYIGKRRDFSTTFLLENIAHSMQLGCVENYGNFYKSAHWQKRYAEAAASNPKIRMYILAQEAIVAGACRVDPSIDENAMTITNTAETAKFLFACLLSPLPPEDASFPMVTFAQRVMNLKDQFIHRKGFLSLSRPPEIDRFHEIFENNTEYLETYVRKIKSQIPASHDFIMAPLLSMIQSFMDARNLIREKISIEDFLHGNEYLRLFPDLPKNPIVIYSERGIKITEKLRKDYKILFSLNHSSEELAYLITPADESYHCFNGDWLKFYTFFCSAEQLFHSPVNYKSPLAYLFLGLLHERGIKIQSHGA